MPNVEDLDEGTWADALRVLVGFGWLQPLDVAYAIGPGQLGRKRLTELALGLAKVKSSGQPICSAGILLEVGLEVFDRPGEVPRHLAGAAHREEEPRRGTGLLARSRAWDSKPHAALGSGWITGSSGSSSRRAKVSRGDPPDVRSLDGFQ